MTLKTLNAQNESVDVLAQKRKQIVEENMGLVGSVVKRFAGIGRDMEDLYQIGCLGLVKAVERFDASFGVKLSTYAVPVILGEIKRFLRDDGSVRISRSLKTNAMHIRAFVEQTEKTSGTTPSVLEIAAHLNIEPEDVLLALESLQPMQYLQAPDAETGFSLMDTLCAPDTEERLLDRLALRQAIAHLSDTDRKIISMRYDQNKTQAQVAQTLGISQVQVSRLEKKLLNALRNRLASPT